MSNFADNLKEKGFKNENLDDLPIIKLENDFRNYRCVGLNIHPYIEENRRFLAELKETRNYPTTYKKIGKETFPDLLK